VFAARSRDTKEETLLDLFLSVEKSKETLNN
jgi:hypothetical protein